MHTQLTTTLSFPSNTERLCYQTIYSSLLSPLQRKFLNATTSSLRKSVVTKTTYTYWQALLQNTVGLEWSECSKASLQESYSKNFLCLKKTCGEVNSGVMVSTLPQSASEEIGKRSKDMSQVRERQWMNCDSLHYSPKVSHRSYPVGLPRGN